MMWLVILVVLREVLSGMGISPCPADLNSLADLLNMVSGGLLG